MAEKTLTPSKRAVVTAFLRHGDRVLIVRRSEKVGSYRGRWSAISGYLEDPTPLAQALREISEETGLASDKVRLAHRPEPLEVPDVAMGVMWVIHPFLFDVERPEEVRLDWENVDLRWILPGEIADFPTVPALEEVLAACLEGEDA